MRLLIISTLPLVAWVMPFVHAAINPDGTHASEALTDDDPSPINDPTSYVPDQYDCPLPCVDYANMHSWTPYFSVERLQRCKEPMLLQLSVKQPLDDPTSSIIIRACALALSSEASISSYISIPQVENPKKAGNLAQSPLESALACKAADTATKTQGNLRLAYSPGNATNGGILGLLEGMREFFQVQDNCDENFLFGYHQETVASVYIGEYLSKPTTNSAIQTLIDYLDNSSTAFNHTVAQICEDETSTESMLGIAIDTTGDLVAVQNAAAEWSQGRCVTRDDIVPAIDLPGIEVLSVANINGTMGTTNSTVRGIPKRSSRLSHRADGTCVTHLIKDQDTCDKVGQQYGVTTSDIEKWNKGKTWAWTECKDMLVGYNMCVSDGLPPMPPPQQGAECGPLVPGTQAPSDPATSLADLNPCPLKACCSNWGFCGVFPAHCDIHAPEGGGPGSKLKEFQNTCVSNCGTGIKQNSGPPTTFERIGYYESWNLERECLWLKSSKANVDGTYTHIHWGFLQIDPNTWKPVIKDSKSQWNDFKNLKNVKRIVSFGGWAYSTDAATYNIIRSAIINNRDTFAANIAQFLDDEGLDGVDIDWEYPGAPDIMVGGSPIGQKSDGLDYLKFLTVLKKAIGTKSVSIAAPASYWYLKAFPIDRIASVIDYIVYMTYDLHGQWDFGNVNSFDMCPSGKCIRSHVNLTETRNSLAMITRAGVPNNKIFVGEASYGRSFHMAQDGCYGPLCDFTGTRTQSDAAPGRCTKEGGYLSYAEINEIIKRGDGAQTLTDTSSNTDVLLYKGDYISYSTPDTKNKRRTGWKSLNFAGTIDWAVDLQSFTADDLSAKPDRPNSGEEGCISGDDLTVNTGSLCEFACNFGFCPQSLCRCTETDIVYDLPEEKDSKDFVAWDEGSVDTARLCKFACKYGYCPEDVCTTADKLKDEDVDEVITVDDPNEYFNYTDARWQNEQKCVLFDPPDHDLSVRMCEKPCKDKVDAAKEEGRTTNYGCMGFWPLDEPIPWEKPAGASAAAVAGKCLCDNWLLNELADTVLEAMPMIAQIGCYVLMQSFKLVVDIGVQLIPVVGKPLDAALDMLTTAGQMAAYLYPEEEDPEGAFSWWLSPCGGTDLVPEDIKKAFGILSTVANGVSSFKTPKNIQKGSGKKGDDGNPTDRAKPRPGGGSSGTGKQKPCKIPASKQTERMGPVKNTLRVRSCVQSKTVTTDFIATSIVYANNAVATSEPKPCKRAWGQACYHYSSANNVNAGWATLTCPPEAATTEHRFGFSATSTWSSQHNGGKTDSPAERWQDRSHRVEKNCGRDEWPPAYLLSPNDPAALFSGVNSQGQLVRWIPQKQNAAAAAAWKGYCMKPSLTGLSDRTFRDRAEADRNSNRAQNAKGNDEIMVQITVYSRPEFTWSSFEHASNPPANYGLNDNQCWPRGIAAQDPGFVLLTYDPWYNNQAPPYNYEAKYVQGSNGS